MRYLLCFICLSLVTDSFAASPVTLFDVIDQRLELMDEVAAYKWNNQIPIEDLERERVVLDRAATTALNLGIRPEALRTFFQVQMEAAKDIQRYWIRQYESGVDPGTPPNLSETVRPELLRLGDAITSALSASAPVAVSREQDFNASVQVEGLGSDRRQSLFAALASVEKYSNRLIQIRETGKLRVGTTGDYAPFSLDRDGTFTGIDIDLARDLAASLEVELDFVKTSWPTLMEDLENGLYDVGMSGISRNTARQRVGFFTGSYHRGGKTPIARCDDAGELDSLEKIDRTDVRVIVNPGGTNHRFVTNNIKKAQVTVHADNRTIFDEIIRGRADVMITDAIEVTLKSNQHDDLCTTMPGQTLTYLEKAYLMPQDIYLKEFVNTWLELRLRDGTVEKIFNRHLKAD
jgi:cyclohexadienyl dehydratase